MAYWLDYIPIINLVLLALVATHLKHTSSYASATHGLTLRCVAKGETVTFVFSSKTELAICAQCYVSIKAQLAKAKAVGQLNAG